MSNPNYFSGIVKILEIPKNYCKKRKNILTSFRAEIPQYRKNKIVRLILWGNLVNNINASYKIGDYILIEGYISLRINRKRNVLGTKINQVTLNVNRIFPVLINFHTI